MSEVFFDTKQGVFVGARTSWSCKRWFAWKPVYIDGGPSKIWLKWVWKCVKDKVEFNYNHPSGFPQSNIIRDGCVYYSSKPINLNEDV